MSAPDTTGPDPGSAPKPPPDTSWLVFEEVTRSGPTPEGDAEQRRERRSGQ